MSTPITVEAVMTSIVALTTALNRVAENQDRLLAGQTAAIEKIEGAKAPTTRRKKADEPAAVVAEEKAPETPAVAETFFTVPDSVEAFKEYVGKWTGEVEPGTPERAKRVDLLKAIASHFGVNPKFPELFPHVKEAVFFIERSKAGLEVNLKVDYDYSGDPKQGGEAPAADEDDFG